MIKLGPNSCGWRYVEGLRVDDDPGLAIFWDKVGLGHNGQRLSEPGHTVFFIGGDQRFIAGTDWQPFLSEQARLLEQRTNAILRVSGAIEVGGEQVRAGTSRGGQLPLRARMARMDEHVGRTPCECGPRTRAWRRGHTDSDQGRSQESESSRRLERKIHHVLRLGNRSYSLTGRTFGL